MLVVFLYTGLEVGAGQWEATFCRSELGLSAGRAGLAVFSYWGALTVVRLAIGSRRRPPPAGRIIWTGLGLGALGTAVIWWRPSPLAAVAGFVLLGAALAGVFPALVMVTPSRIGSTRSQHVIAWQIGAAAVGGSGLSALIGLVLDTAGLGTLGAALSALAILTLLANAALARIAPLT
jgi:fucose permease